VKFTDKSNGDISSWKWSFGDGTYSTCKNPYYTYCKAGKYTVSLTIKDSEGNKKTKCKCVTVTDSSKKASAKNTKKVCNDTKKTSNNNKNTNKNIKKT
jgi:PKD repeat protein